MSDASEVKAAAERVRRNVHAYDPGGQEKQRQDIAAVLNDWWAEHDETPVTPEWLRSITALPVCKNGSGGYSDSEVTLFLDDWESRQKEDRFWVLSLRDDGPEKGWSASVSVYEGHRYGGRLYMAPIKTRGEVRRLCAVLGIELKESSK